MKKFKDIAAHVKGSTFIGITFREKEKLKWQ